MPAVPKAGRVARQPPVAPRHAGGAVRDRVAQLATALMPVDPLAEGVAGNHVVGPGRPHLHARRRNGGDRSLHHRQRLANDEAELRVQRQRPVVVGGLDEPDAGGSARARARERRLHHQSPDAVVLDRGTHDHRADPRDRSALIDERAADNRAGALCAVATARATTSPARATTPRVRGARTGK